MLADAFERVMVLATRLVVVTEFEMNRLPVMRADAFERVMVLATRLVVVTELDT